MGILSWILLGLVAGLLARWLMPGPNPTGFWKTTVIGIVGALIGGWLGAMAGIGGPVANFSLGSVFTATIGALILLAFFRVMQK